MNSEGIAAGPQEPLCGTHGWQDGRGWRYDFRLGRRVWDLPCPEFPECHNRFPCYRHQRRRHCALKQTGR